MQSQRGDLLERRGQIVFGDGAIVVILHSSPESFGHTEELGQTQTRIGRDGALAGNDVANTSFGMTERRP